METTSSPGRKSSTNATCLLRKLRQSIGGKIPTKTIRVTVPDPLGGVPGYRRAHRHGRGGWIRGLDPMEQAPGCHGEPGSLGLSMCFRGFARTPFEPSVQRGRDDLRERVARPVQPRLHRAEIARRDLGDLLVRLALELAQDEHLLVMLREPFHRFLDQLTQVALP